MPLNDANKVAAIIVDAGGRVVGRTRLQKIAYLLTVTGLESGFAFSYKHYGPYSEDLATAARMGNLFGNLSEAEHATSWGGSYSIYTAVGRLKQTLIRLAGSLLELQRMRTPSNWSWRLPQFFLHEKGTLTHGQRPQGGSQRRQKADG